MKNIIRTIALCGLPLAAAVHVQAQSLSGAGSTAAAPLYVAISERLGSKSGFALNYSSVGSGEGIRRIQERTVDFGASDRPLTRQELSSGGLLQFPTAIGAVAITANLPGVNLAQLKLNGAMLADIYLGNIKTWRDPKILALNPALNLPDQPIRRVIREEGSGTAYAFNSYLGRVHADWLAGAKAAQAGAQTAKGNLGVLQMVQSTVGAIGYLEYGYAQENKLPAAQLQNAFGTYVSPSSDTIAAVVRAADWELLFMDNNPSFEINTINVACPQCWPIVSMTYVMVPRRWNESSKAASFVRFLESLLNDGDSVAREENFVPLPSRGKNLVKVTLRSQMVDPKGARLR